MVDAKRELPVFLRTYNYPHVKNIVCSFVNSICSTVKHT